MVVLNEVGGVGELSQLMARVQSHGWIGEIPRDEYEALKEYLTNTLARASEESYFETELDVLGVCVNLFAVGSEFGGVSVEVYLNEDSGAMFLISYDAWGTTINLEIVDLNGYDGPEQSFVGSDWDEILCKGFEEIGDWMLKFVSTHYLTCAK